MLTTLKKLKSVSGQKGPVLLIIMDGVGIGEDKPWNAVHVAKTPTLDFLKTQPLYRHLKAHGHAVGMPTDDDMGNSEVGHNALGAGRIFDQGAALVENAIQTETLFDGRTWKDALKNVTDKQSTLHFLGLLSDGNVHAHIRHLIAMLKKAADTGIQNVRVHVLTDGRDVGERSALGYIDSLENCLNTINQDGKNYKIASGGGRMITTMDRYNADWSIVERGWKTHVLGEAETFGSARDAIQTYYNRDPKINDQYLPPFVIAENGSPIGTIQDGDSIILTNFRGDRAIEITQAFVSKDFNKFDRVRHPDVYFAGMMQYDGDLQLPENFLVTPPQIKKPISTYLCGTGLRSFAISETQKFGHVTYFWNGNNSGYIDKNLETYVEIPSDTIPFEQKPEMKAREITEKSIELLTSGQFDFGRINLPNGDMVGHTGVMDAAVNACEVTDECVKKLIDTIHTLNGTAIILADHGNADIMWTEKNGIRTAHTAHTLNPVPCAIVDSQNNGIYTLRDDLPNAGLANVAATICNLLGYEAPGDYEPSLIKLG